MPVTWPTSFATHRPCAITVSLAILLTVTVTAGAASVALAIDAAGLREATTRLEARTDAVEDTRARLRAGLEGVPDDAELARVRDRVHEFAPLARAATGEIGAALAALERTLPAEARLEQLRWRRQGSEIRFAASAPSREMLTRLLEDLEAAPPFSEALLVKQEQASDGAGFRFEFRVLGEDAG